MVLGFAEFSCKPPPGVDIKALSFSLNTETNPPQRGNKVYCPHHDVHVQDLPNDAPRHSLICKFQVFAEETPRNYSIRSYQQVFYISPSNLCCSRSLYAFYALQAQATHPSNLHPHREIKTKNNLSAPSSGVAPNTLFLFTTNRKAYCR